MFKKRVKKEIEEIFANFEDVSKRKFSYDDLAGLPEPVQRYLRYSLKDGQEYISCVRLKHAGVFRQRENQKWMQIRGEEYFTTQPPAFIWYAKVKPIPFFWIAARDKYVGGKGNMLIKLLSSITVADAKGKEMDLASLIRFFSEMPWYPTAFFLNEFLQWEEIDSQSAKATIRDHGIEASGIFYFNEKGEITHFVTEDRFMTVGNKYQKEKWCGYYRQYKEINLVKVPTEVEIV